MCYGFPPYLLSRSPSLQGFSVCKMHALQTPDLSTHENGSSRGRLALGNFLDSRVALADTPFLLAEIGVRATELLAITRVDFIVEPSLPGGKMQKNSSFCRQQNFPYRSKKRQFRGLIMRWTLATLLFFLVLPQMWAQTKTLDFSSIDRIMAAALKAHKVPGAVIVIGHDDHVVFHKAYGHRSLIPGPTPMTENTIDEKAASSASRRGLSCENRHIKSACRRQSRPQLATRGQVTH